MSRPDLVPTRKRPPTLGGFVQHRFSGFPVKYCTPRFGHAAFREIGTDKSACDRKSFAAFFMPARLEAELGLGLALAHC